MGTNGNQGRFRYGTKVGTTGTKKNLSLGTNPPLYKRGGGTRPTQEPREHMSNIENECLHGVNIKTANEGWAHVSRPDINVNVTICECCLGPSSLLDSGPQVVVTTGVAILLRPRCKRCRLDITDEE